MNYWRRAQQLPIQQIRFSLPFETLRPYTPQPYGSSFAPCQNFAMPWNNHCEKIFWQKKTNIFEKNNSISNSLKIWNIFSQKIILRKYVFQQKMLLQFIFLSYCAQFRQRRAYQISFRTMFFLYHGLHLRFSLQFFI